MFRASAATSASRRSSDCCRRWSNRIRLWLVDVASLVFCAFFAWKSWTLAHEAWVDGQVTNSMWSAPLAIPYVLMASGMTLLCLQILLQLMIPLSGTARR